MAATLQRPERQAEEEGPWADVMGPGARPVLARVPCTGRLSPEGRLEKGWDFPLPSKEGESTSGRGAALINTLIS